MPSVGFLEIIILKKFLFQRIGISLIVFIGKKIIVDVGCGVGEWSLNQAKLYPEFQYIGIEKTHQRSNQLIKNKNQLGLNNYLAIQADAITLIDQVFPKLSVDEYYFFHPNPWIKKNRLIKDIW